MCKIRTDVDHGGGYSVCRCGDVYNRKGEKLATWNSGEKGFEYEYVTLLRCGKRTSSRLHRIIYLSFNKEANQEWDIDHVDGDRLNNNLSNLRSIPHELNVLLRKRVKGQSILGRGISHKGNKFRATLLFRGRTVLRQTYSSLQEAKDAQLKAYKETIILSCQENGLDYNDYI